VNWFRRNKDGKFLWPGFGDNLRVLNWIVERCQGKGSVVETPIGYLPQPGAIDTTGLDISEATMRELLAVDKSMWQKEFEDIGEYFASYGSRLPKELRLEQQSIFEELS
jgi:phosphoenolpyruvate carboxykinase (GTP)